MAESSTTDAIASFLDDDQNLMIVVALAVVVCSILYYLCSGKTFVKGNAVILLGNMSSGKTALFYRLKNDAFLQTVTSVQMNKGKFTPACLANSTASSTVWEYVDLPGHGSFRHSLSTLLPTARGVVFLIDSADDTQMESNSQFLYSLLVDASLSSRRIPILVAYNKMDADGSLGSAILKPRLEAALEKYRGIKEAMPEMSVDDRTIVATVPLGKKGSAFKFAHSSCPVESADISVKTGNLTALQSWLMKLN